jgi:hypothetical protein
MSPSRNVASWLVLGPIYSDGHQTACHHPGDGHPTAADIIMDVDSNGFDPKELARSLEKAPKAGDSVAYGTGGLYPNRTYAWRSLNFDNIDWSDIHDVEDNIHRRLGAGAVPTDPGDARSFFGKHHALAFFLIYIESPDSRNTTLFVNSDDSIRVWLNGQEIDSLRYAGDRDIRQGSQETCAEISLRAGSNILLAAVADTHKEWGFSARLENAGDLKFSTDRTTCA